MIKPETIRRTITQVCREYQKQGPFNVETLTCMVLQQLKYKSPDLETLKRMIRQAIYQAAETGLISLRPTRKQVLRSKLEQTLTNHSLVFYLPSLIPDLIKVCQDYAGEDT